MLSALKKGSTGDEDGRRFRVWLTALGMASLAAAAVVLFKHAAVDLPYRYETLAAPAPASGAAPGGASQELSRVQVVRTADDQVLAQADIAQSARGPVLVAWRAQVDDPFLHMTVDPAEAQAIAAVLARYRGSDTPVLAWWDTSRQLRHFGAGEVSFGSHFGLPLFVPAQWQDLRSKVSNAEAAFWKTSRDAAQEVEFREFVGALVSDESEGVKTLRKLAQGRKAVLVLHVRDILLLGQMEPKKVGVSFRDFSDPGDVHRSVRGVQDWLREDKGAAYTVLKRPNNMLRAVALTDEATGNTLAARLLPFVGNRQEDVVGLTLVYRAGGFSVFELNPVGER